MPSSRRPPVPSPVFALALPLWLGAAVSPAVAADYYVSPGGSDAHPGTSPAAPWKTIARVNRARFAPGDRILFKGGAAFSGGVRFDREDAGTPSRPIVVSRYGSGRATIHAGAESAIYAHNTAGFTISHLNLRGAGRTENKGDGIRFYNDLPGGVLLEHIFIDNVEASGFGQRGISLGGWSGRSGFRGIRVTESRVTDNAREGLLVYAQLYNVNELVYIRGVRADHNTGIPGFADISGSGIVLGSVRGGVVERCVAHDNGISGNGGVGIYTYDSDGIVLQYNESYDNRTSGAIDGGGLDLDQNTANSVMQYNYTHGNDGAGYGVFQLGTRPTHTNNVVRYNISQNDGRKNDYAGIFVAHGVRDTDIYNNTIFVSPAPSGTPSAFRVNPGCANITVRNNLFVTTGGVPLVYVLPGNTGLVFQGNNYWSSGASFNITWDDGKAYPGLAAWRAATAQERLGETPVGFSVDPKLVGAGKGPVLGNAALLGTLQAYRLRGGSPMIDAGLDLEAQFAVISGERDFFGSALRRGKGPDIGCHEFGQ